jgi:RNA polymerase sigma factor (sigma-70 family)
MNGTQLLDEFRATRSDEAFSELVRRYTNLVYSAAWRRLSNTAHAQEVTQLVFVRLSRTVPRLDNDAALAAWLHRTTVHVSIDLWRSETRRRTREQHAITMNSEPDGNTLWNEIAPILDDVLNELTDADRQTVLMRFFNGKSMRELGQEFGVSEDAAKMRVSRALERLRARLAGHGVTCGVAALGTLLAARSVEAAPVQLVDALAACKFGATAASSASGWCLAFPAVARHWLAASLTTSLVAVTIALVLWHSAKQSNPSPTQTAATASASPDAPQPQTQIPDNAADAQDAVLPDPRTLFQHVIQARLQITSGSMEMQTSYGFDGFRGIPRTNRCQLKVTFDGARRRFEQRAVEYRYIGTDSDVAEKADAIMRAKGLDQEGGVREGLLERFQARYVSIWDGAAVMQYRETDGRPDGTTIDEPGRSSSYLFDPRCLGLSHYFSASETLENLADYLGKNTTVSLLGRENVAEAPAWHIRIQFTNETRIDLWIATNHRDRVLKMTGDGHVITSTYDSPSFSSPIPSGVTVRGPARNGKPGDERIILSSNIQLNVPVDPETWTLAGLGMPLGTDVSDNRIHRRIGYWTGTGLSDALPRKNSKSQEQDQPVKIEELLSILDTDPASPGAFSAANWILLNSPDGTNVNKAASVILAEHLHSTDLLQLAEGLQHLRHQCSQKLLEGMIAQNPDAVTRVQACYSLAMLLKDASKYGQDSKAAAESARWFGRVQQERGSAGSRGTQLARQSETELYEIRHLFIGRPAPALEGEDLEGQPMSLASHRGKVVMLVFWDNSYLELEYHRKLRDQMSGRPFVLLGVNDDKDPGHARQMAEKLGVTWPSFWHDGKGAIQKDWQNRSWPSVYLLDQNGVIRHRDLHWDELTNAVRKMVGE